LNFRVPKSVRYIYKFEAFIDAFDFHKLFLVIVCLIYFGGRPVLNGKYLQWSNTFTLRVKCGHFTSDMLEIQL